MRSSLEDERVAGDIAHEANSSHAHCTRLSRRISEKRAAQAEKGKGTGGKAAYGYRWGKRKVDGEWKPTGNYVLGDPKHVKVVKLIFDLFANKLCSPHWIAGKLNGTLSDKDKKIPPPGRGRQWSSKTVRDFLSNPSYVGDLRYGEEPTGQFTRLNAEDDVVRRKELNGKRGKVTIVPDTHEGIISRALWNKAQRRLKSLKSDRGRSKRGSYALAGVLRCGHCGSRMHGFPDPHSGIRKYRCSGVNLYGKDFCFQYEVEENEILPYIMRLFGKEIKNLREVLEGTSAPDELRFPRKEDRERREELEGREKELTEQLKKAARNLATADPENLPFLDEVMTEMRTELAEVKAELAADQPKSGYTNDDLERLNDWYEDWMKRPVSVPVKYEVWKDMWETAAFYTDPDEYSHGDEKIEEYENETVPQRFLLDPLIVNEGLEELGARVTFWWKREPYTASSGRPLFRNGKPVRGRFRLGQQSGKIPGYVFRTPALRRST